MTDPRSIRGASTSNSFPRGVQEKDSEHKKQCSACGLWFGSWRQVLRHRPPCERRHANEIQRTHAYVQKRVAAREATLADIEKVVRKYPRGELYNA